jgi:hypothetical protein
VRQVRVRPSYVIIFVNRVVDGEGLQLRLNTKGVGSIQNYDDALDEGN